MTILVSPQLANCADEWTPLGERVCMLRLKLLDRSLCLIQVSATTSSELYVKFVEIMMPAKD